VTPRNAGFTLLEVIVAFIIAALALSALFGGGLAGLTSTATSARYQEALARAESHLAAAASEGALAASDRQGDEGGNFHWRVRVTVAAVAGPVPDAPAGSPVPALYDITVQESWPGRDRSRVVTLQTRRAGTAPGRTP
jgi:general secretion pathway protein I